MIIVLSAFLVMLIFIWSSEGWLRALLILGSFFVSIFIVNVIMIVIGFNKYNIVIADRILLGIWTIGSILYNILNGYIKND